MIVVMPLFDDAIRNVLVLEDRPITAAEPQRRLVAERQVDPGIPLC